MFRFRAFASLILLTSAFVYGWSAGLRRYHCPLYTLMLKPLLNLRHGRGALLVTYEVESTEAHLFAPEVDGRALTFKPDGETRMRDEQTDSIWNLRTGETTAGQLRGKRLKRKVGTIAYRRAWLAFYPKSKVVTEEGETQCAR